MGLHEMTYLPKLASGARRARRCEPARKSSSTFLQGGMMKPLVPEALMSLCLSATVLIAASALAACSSVPAPPTPVLKPVEVRDNAVIPSARLSWHDAPETTRAGSFSTGIEIEYDRATGQSAQRL